MLVPKTTQLTHARWEEVEPSESDVPELVRKKYLIVDTYWQNPPYSGLGIPGPEGDYCDIGPNGLPDLDEAEVEQMQPEERASFLKAKADELEWQSQWRSESVDGARAKLKIGFTGVPV